MQYMLITACFKLGSLNRKHIVDIIETRLQFEPTNIMTDDFLRNGGCYRKKYLSKILLSKRTITNIRIDERDIDEGCYFEWLKFPIWNFEVLYWKLPYEANGQILVSHCMKFKGFNTAYISDEEDVFWQSMEDISTYSLYNKPYKHLPTVIDPDFNEIVIDISENPGVRYFFPGTWLQSCWAMWFKGDILEYIPKERLVGFRFAYSNNVLPDGTVNIVLFESLKDFDTHNSRKIQSSFKKWISLVNLHNAAPELLSDNSDPFYALDEKGGVRILSIWLDARGNPIRRSLATKKLIQSFDDTSCLIDQKEIGM